MIPHIWPVVFIAGLGGVARNMRVIRGNLLDVLNTQYVTTARSKGLTESSVINKHAVPNASHAIIAYQGTVLPYMLAGELEAAIVWNLPTLAPLFYTSLVTQDIYISGSLLLIYGAMIVIGNLLSDILLGVVRSDASNTHETIRWKAAMSETAGLGPLDRPGTAFPMPDVDELGETTATLQTVGLEVQETYFQLIWRRFRKSKIAILGGLMVIALSLLAVFADFFSPNPLRELNMEASFTPPTRIHFVDTEGNFHLRPFVYTAVVTIDMTTFVPTWEEDTSVMYPMTFFPEGSGIRNPGRHSPPTATCSASKRRAASTSWAPIVWARPVGQIVRGRPHLADDGAVRHAHQCRDRLGRRHLVRLLRRADRHIMQRGVEFVNAFPQLPLWMALAAIIPRTWDSLKIFIIMSIIFAMLSWTTLAREVRGKVLSYRESDFVLAAKEMGASDSRIIFRHLYPNMLSHIIVVLTLTIPGIILAEAFLSFLGIGIQEPLTSWGLLMRQAQTIDVLGEYTWMMTPVLFIITAVLGFNFLGDGLRDAADPYATM